MCEPYTDIWQFATTVYRKQGVETYCIQLQDEYGANIPLALWLLWLDCHEQSAGDGRLLAAGKAIAEDWQSQVITPMRQARRWLKQHSPIDDTTSATRHAIQDAELTAEQSLLLKLQQLTVLERELPACSASPSLSLLSQYITQLTDNQATQREALACFSLALE